MSAFFICSGWLHKPYIIFFISTDVVAMSMAIILLSSFMILFDDVPFSFLSFFNSDTIEKCYFSLVAPCICRIMKLIEISH